jgi:hypothetical protein
MITRVPLTNATDVADAAWLAEDAGRGIYLIKGRVTTDESIQAEIRTSCRLLYYKKALQNFET